jgi:hypothetical protein
MAALFPHGVHLSALRPGPIWAGNGVATALAADGTPITGWNGHTAHARLRAHQALEQTVAAFHAFVESMAWSTFASLGRPSVDVRPARTPGTRIHFHTLNWDATRETSGQWQGVEEVAALLHHGARTTGRPTHHMLVQHPQTAGLCARFRTPRAVARAAAQLMASATVNGPVVPQLAALRCTADPKAMQPPKPGSVPDEVLVALEHWRSVQETPDPSLRTARTGAVALAWHKVRDAIARWSPALLHQDCLSGWSLGVRPTPDDKRYPRGIEICGFPIHTEDELALFGGLCDRKGLLVTQGASWSTPMPLRAPWRAAAVFHALNQSLDEGNIEVWQVLRKSPTQVQANTDGNGQA